MSAGDPKALLRWREALLWLAKADADISGEKALKGLLVAAAQDVRCSHDTDAFATLAWPHLPDLIPPAAASPYCPGSARYRVTEYGRSFAHAIASFTERPDRSS